MEILPLGNIPPAPSTASLPAILETDSVATLLQQMTATTLLQLVEQIQSAHPAVNPTLISELLHAAASAAVAGDLPRALAAITNLVDHSPELADTLPLELVLAPVRAQVEDHLIQLTSAVKLDAEARFSSALQLAHASRPGGLNAREILPVVEQLIDSGRYSNIVLAADLSQAVINYYGPFEIPAPRQWATGALPRNPNKSSDPPLRNPAPWAGAAASVYGGTVEFLKGTWGHSPVLFLFIIWILMSTMTALVSFGGIWSSELSLEVWGAGSAGLLGLGTYRRLRKT